MRISQFIIKKNVSIARIIFAFEYLNLNPIRITSKISEEKIHLIENTLENEKFQEWFKAKIIVDRIEILNAKNLIAPINQFYSKPLDDIECERILNAFSFLLKRLLFNQHKAQYISEILISEKTSAEKISLLKKSGQYDKHSKFKREDYLHRESSYDPYENFSWGGLTGEEAYIGYWNTE